MSRRFYVSAAAAVILWCVSINAFAITYTSITVFGDSLSDGGNDFLYTGGFPPAPYAQRFTNGPTAVENLAAGLGLPLSPSLAGGSNYAYGGAETGTANYLRVRPDVPPIINTIFSGQPNFPDTGTLAQVQSFVAAPPAGFGGPQSLVVLWAGANDVFTALTLSQPLNTVIAPAMNNLAQSVQLLYGAGARTLLMPDMANLGVTPFGLGSGDPGGLTAFSAAFNFFLDQTIAGLESALPGLTILESDTFSHLTEIVMNPGAYGFTNWTDPCFDGISACSNPDQYVFWDTVHPTARTHAILGADFLHAVPEPSAILLLAIGMAGMAVSRRRPRLS
jgi:phospholipase/lecithinase/hemolysin